MIIKPSTRFGDIKTYYFAIKLSQIAKMNEAGEDVINLGIGSPDLSPPEEVLDTLRAASQEKDANMYQSYKGIKTLREAFAYHYQSLLNVTIDPDTEVLPLIGSKEGIMHIAMSFLDQGDEVLVPNPGYPSYRVTTQLALAQPRYYNLSAEGDWLPDLEVLAQQDLSKVKLMWINYPHMPTGAKATKAFYEKLIAFAQKHKILICHDNPYNFILNDQPLSIFSVPGAKSCAIELSSLSKCYNMAGWRVGAVIGAKDYIDTVMRFKSNMDSGMYKAVQKAASKALCMDQSWFDQLNAIYTKRRETVWKIFDLLGCQYEKTSAGLFVWARIPDTIDDVEAWVEDILQKAKVFITPGFIFGTQGARYARIALCSETAVLEEAYERIAHRYLKLTAS